MENLQAKELRIGNWVYHSSGNIIDVEIINSDIEEDDLQPIPLTEEWLVKLGFKRYTDRHYTMSLSSRGLINVYLSPDGDLSVELGTTTGYLLGYPPITHVHHLQNLYWCLCGKELEIIS